MRLYRYRSIDSAIRDLSTNSFFFASREELNDPLESYVRLYWQGDKPAWEGLFRNYACSLFNAIEMYLLKADKYKIHVQTVLMDIHAFSDLPIGEIINSVGVRFIHNSEIQKLAEFYGENNKNCGTKELMFVLRSVHELALKICIEEFMNHQLISKEQGDLILKTIKDDPEFGIVKLMKIENNGEGGQLLTLDQTKRRLIFTDLENDAEDIITQQMILIDDKYAQKIMNDEREFDVDGSIEAFLYKNEEGEAGNQLRNWLAIRGNYPQIYVNQLKEAIFPNSYVVCFSKNADDSSMWGNYADNHKGVCLIYDSDELYLSTKNLAESCSKTENKNDITNEITDVNTVSSVDSCKKAYVKPVKYTNDEMIKRNFFETLGQLNLAQIKRWLTGKDGISSIYQMYADDTAKWRERYWEDADKKNNTKLECWEHEQEYRMNHLDIFGRLRDEQAKEERLYKCNSKALKGLIFGIKTSEYDIKRVIDAIPSEYDFSDKKGFEIFQADYNDELQKIEIRKKLIVIEKRNK